MSALLHKSGRSFDAIASCSSSADVMITSSFLGGTDNHIWSGFVTKVSTTPRTGIIYNIQLIITCIYTIINILYLIELEGIAIQEIQIPSGCSCCLNMKSNLVVGRDDGFIMIVNEQLDILTTFDAHDNIISCMEAISDFECITGDWDGNIKIWDLQHPEKSIMDFGDTHNGAIRGIASHPRSNHSFVSIATDGLLR
jgi:WD40 repeat protein